QCSVPSAVTTINVPPARFWRTVNRLEEGAGNGVMLESARIVVLLPRWQVRERIGAEDLRDQQRQAPAEQGAAAGHPAGPLPDRQFQLEEGCLLAGGQDDDGPSPGPDFRPGHRPGL